MFVYEFCLPIGDCFVSVGTTLALQEANGNVPLDGVAFSQLDWLESGRKFSDFWGK